jgi:hypothetical protein
MKPFVPYEAYLELERTTGAKPECTSDTKVFVEASGLATYPDVSVVCGPVVPHPGDPNAMTNPSVVVEVLSASTEAYDRGASRLPACPRAFRGLLPRPHRPYGHTSAVKCPLTRSFSSAL